MTAPGLAHGGCSNKNYLLALTGRQPQPTKREVDNEYRQSH